MDGHTNAVICLLVVNRLMYTGSADGSAKCWVTEFGDCTRQYRGHKGSVIATRFQSGIRQYYGAGTSIDGNFPRIKKTKNTIFSLEVLKSDPCHRCSCLVRFLHVPSPYILSCISLSSQLCLTSVWTACGDSICRAYDAKSGTLKRSYVGHEAAVNCMVITEGKLYTGSSDGTLRIWDAKEKHKDIDGQPLEFRFEMPLLPTC